MWCKSHLLKYNTKCYPNCQHYSSKFSNFFGDFVAKQPILRNTSTAGRFCKFLCNAGQMQKELLHASNVLFQSLVAICHFVSCNGVMYDKKGTRSCRIPLCAVVYLPPGPPGPPGLKPWFPPPCMFVPSAVPMFDNVAE